MKSEYDVLIIGGGPGGALAAKTCAEKGLSVCIVEKRPAIGTPVRCAEGIGEDLIGEFFDKIDPKWISAKIKGAKLISPDGSSFYLNPEMAGNEVGYVLDRKFFDRDLVWQAVEAGAECYVKARAVDAILENGVVKGAVIEHFGILKDVRASIVIAADGVESKFAKYCGIDTTVPLRELETCAQYLMTDIDIEPGITAFYVGREICPEGYIWIFPKGDRTANVGIGISGTQSKDGSRAKDYLDKFVSRNFPEGKIIELIVGGVSVCEPLECTVADNLIIVGDAARLSDPITGGGIYNAMYTGRLAGQVAAESIRSGDCSKKALMKYETTWRSSKMGKALDRNYQIKEIFVKLSDKQLDSILTSVSNIVMKDFSTLTLIKEIIKLNPKLIKELSGLRKYFE
ncbi:MAG: NAD(P)/FAD-dependent oxidoreductase [Methanomicrobiaceae archaeon]|nr:NAD(P)/FAD-dependent oxidoreductase [Methanomicrobiaceae archaeon]